MNPENTGFTQPIRNLRDELAVERTILSNERSLLSYIRTTIACLAASFSLLHFFQTNWWLRIFAMLLLLLSLGIISYGLKRYHQVKYLIKKVE